MLIGVKKEKELAEKLAQQKAMGKSYRDIVLQQFRKNRMAVWSLRFLYVLLFISLTADFIANERPLYCQLEGKTYFPVLKQYAVDLGLSTWEANFFQNNWHDHDYDRVIWAPIPYSANTLDKKNTNFVAPGDEQRVSSPHFRHWMGTDQLGRDVAAGMIAGTRTAMLVGLISMTVATIIGVFFGALAGYFGDDRFRVTRARLFLNLLAIVPAIFYGFIARSYQFSEGSFGAQMMIGLLIVLLIFGAANGVAYWLNRFDWFGKKLTLPVDIMVMRLIEMVSSIPALLLVLSVVAIIEKPSIFYIMVIIGFIRWTGIARFIRAELLKIRSLEYIEAAEALGYSEWRIIIRHAVPNALTPVLITVAFGIASAILLEAFLSFLGIGLPPSQITWGKLLNFSRSQFSAWWLAIFPGLAIFFTVTIFNLLGEGLTDALDPRLKQ